ncbi:MAG: hypothetical protein ACQEVA_06250 [Myxococcota bacterium]
MPSIVHAQESQPEGGSPEAPPAEQTEDDAPATEYRVDRGTLIVRIGDDEQRLETPCDDADVARSDEHFYLTCGASGVYVVRQNPETRELSPRGYQRYDGDVTGFITSEGQIWAKISRTEARPVGPAVADVQPIQRPDAVERPAAKPEPTEPSEPTGSKPTTPQEEPQPEMADAREQIGDVVDVEPGAVIVSLGRDAGIERDDHVELFQEEQVGLGDGETSARISTIAIGKVVAVSEKRARVELGLGERVHTSAQARPTGAPLTSYPTAPPRIGGLWEASFAVRPFLALRTVGAGTISSARVVYRFEGPYAIHVNALPLSGGLAREGNVSAAGADIALAYDARIFSLGLGVGAAQIGYESLGGIDIDEQGGPTITQFGRIGSRDGLHLRLHNAFVVANREFFYSGTDAVIQIPIDSVVSNSALVLHGGGHVAGDAVGEAGLRLLVRGNGDRGSLFVTPTVGGGLVTNERRDPNCTEEYESACLETVSYGGPLIGIDLEWRL